MTVSCLVKRVACPASEMKIVACSSGLGESKEVNPSAVVRAAPGQLTPVFEPDWSKAYFILLIGEEGAGFYLEGVLDDFDNPDCGALVVPALEEIMERLGVRLPQTVKTILYSRVFGTVFQPGL